MPNLPYPKLFWWCHCFSLPLTEITGATVRHSATKIAKWLTKRNLNYALRKRCLALLQTTKCTIIVLYVTQSADGRQTKKCIHLYHEYTIPYHSRWKRKWKLTCKICTITYPQPSITHWHTEQTLSHLYRTSAKRSCGSSLGCDFISELSSFVLEFQIYADKQVYSPFG